MKKISIIGLGWLGMPLALALQSRGYQVVGSKTTADGVSAARLSGVACHCLSLTPEINVDAEGLEALLNVDALIITLPPGRVERAGGHYLQAVEQVVNSALAFGVARIIYTSSISVYGAVSGRIKENCLPKPETHAGQVLYQLEQWLHALPHTEVDILRLAGLVGDNRHPGRFLAGRQDVLDGSHGVNLVHLEDVISAILLLLQRPHGGHLYNLCAPAHPAKQDFYPQQAHRMGLEPPQFLPGDPSVARIIDGQRICVELGFEYQHPDPMTMMF
ncbi:MULTISPECIES: SDR family oxidoreductase [Dickeya]|uniref:Predicted epimerase, with NAD(P)-binding Rossmann-fold domain, YeeZ was found in a cytoplasmic complex together with YbbN n=1 Tax=Dickeya aquatica TaxID=1401087 RepID=A0A375AA90_9GAMM|nr:MULTISPECIES: SDR family oxidoreductase [Dickeya]SLM63008.1 predicted epimerase, with NAD(P)-binding Rossmann-fold domain, YeeZ was found in a cytoplasmic complex together with YbbN [Dickeya aquatica]